MPQPKPQPKKEIIVYVNGGQELKFDNPNVKVIRTG